MFEQALNLYDLGRLGEAERLCVDRLRAQPTDFDATDLLAMIFHRTGRSAVALKLLDRAIMLRSDVATTHNNRGIVLAESGRVTDALASYDRALALAPDFAEAHNNRGNALAALGRREEAVAAFERAVALKPDFVAAHASLGRVLALLNRHAEALAVHDRTLALAPALAEAYGNRGHTLTALRRYSEALADFERMVALKPASPEAHINLGHVLRLLGRAEAAIASFDRAVALNPSLAKAYAERGNAHADLLHHDAALNDFMQATALKPDYVAAHWNEALCRLQLGQFDIGWAMYEWRWRYGAAAEGFKQIARARWSGEDLGGKSILLRCEQGLGDTIQFCRYAPLVAARGARVAIEAQASLLPLLSGLPGLDALYAEGRAPSDFDYECPLLSLPLVFGTVLETIPTSQKYLSSDPARVAAWRARLGAEPGLKIGVAWRGNPGHKNDSKRSIPFAALAPLFAHDATWVSLQIDGEGGHPSLRDVGAAIADFADTAALVDLMDVVIAVDTSVAHLAGALGKPAWVMLPFNPDWRWLLDRADNPWYRSARLFRQPAPGDWSSVVNEVAASLRALSMVR